MQFCTFIVLLAGFTGISLAQPRPASSETSISFDTSGSQPGTHGISAHEIGRLESDKTSAAFTVLVVEDLTRTNRHLRGLRLALSEPEGNRTIYLPEASLQPLKEKLDGMLIALRRMLEEDIGNFMIGTVCPGEEGKLPLSFGYHSQYAAKPELSIGGPDLPQYVFVGLAPSQLLAIFEKAIEDLRLR